MIRAELRQKLETEHFELRSLQARLRDRYSSFVEDSSDFNCEQFRRLFSDFSKSLNQHFDYEEEDGYLQEVCNFKPRYHDLAEKLKGDHIEARQLLVGLQDNLCDGEGVNSKSREKFQQGFEKLMALMSEHEDAERELIIEAFWDEGGVGD